MLQLNNVSIAYDDKIILNDISFELSAGQIGCLLGPSGCGKTTLLRCIAGFENIKSGEIRLRKDLVSTPSKIVAPQQRKIAVVFQDYALFPHLTVKQNIEFGIRQWSTQAKNERVDTLLSLVGLHHYKERYPHELSGGQQQRVALIRAMAPQPDLLLLDEPFSSLDNKLREELAKELRHILKHEDATALMVTHDQQEAFVMADVIGVMDAGHLLQWSDAYTLYHMPNDKFVAKFIGEGVFLDAVIDQQQRLDCFFGSFDVAASHGFTPGDQVSFLLRPDDLVHDETSPKQAKVVDKSFRGSHIMYELMLNNDKQEKLLYLALSHHDYAIGENIGIRLELEHLIVFKKD